MDLARQCAELSFLQEEPRNDLKKARGCIGGVVPTRIQDERQDLPRPVSVPVEAFLSRNTKSSPGFCLTPSTGKSIVKDVTRRHKPS